MLVNFFLLDKVTLEEHGTTKKLSITFLLRSGQLICFDPSSIDTSDIHLCQIQLILRILMKKKNRNPNILCVEDEQVTPTNQPSLLCSHFWTKKVQLLFAFCGDCVLNYEKQTKSPNIWCVGAN